MKKLLITTISLTTLFLFGCQKITTTETQMQIEEETGEKTEEIVEITEETTGFVVQSFDDCLNAGFPIMESYPRQCNDGTTTYTEEIAKEMIQENTTGNIISNIISGENLENGKILETNSQQEQETGTNNTNNLNVLQQKLKAMVERRNQNTQNSSGTINPIQTNTTEATNKNQQVTEEDIENLENIINQILSK